MVKSVPLVSDVTSWIPSTAIVVGSMASPVYVALAIVAVMPSAERSMANLAVTVTSASGIVKEYFLPPSPMSVESVAIGVSPLTAFSHTGV